MPPTTVLKRQAESKIYSYDFKNDPVIVAGDVISTVVSITSVIMINGVTTNLTLGSSSISGTQVLVRISGGQDGAQYEVTFIVTTTGGNTLVGIGYMVVGDEG